MATPAHLPVVSAEFDARVRLLDTLSADREQLADSVSRRVRGTIPSYSSVNRSDHTAGSAVSISLALAAARSEPAGLDHTQIGRLLAVTRERSSVGIPLEDMVQAWYISCRRIVEAARSRAVEMGIGEGVILDIADAMFVATDRAQRLVYETWRTDALTPARSEAAERARADFVIAALDGSLSVSQLHEQAGLVGLDPNQRYLVLVARSIANQGFVQLRRTLQLGGSRPSEEGIVAELDGDLIAILPRRPPGNLPSLVAGAGDPVPLVDLPESFRSAQRALRVAVAFGLTGLQDMGSLGLRAAIADDHDVGRALVKRYIAPVMADPSGTELLASLRGWFAAGMHVSRAAQRLFVHPNTLRYRIARFEALTGANLRDHHTAFEVWWSLERHGVDRESAQEQP